LKVTLVDCVLGLLAFDGENRVVEYVLFPEGLGERVDAILNLQQGIVSPEIGALIAKLKAEGCLNLVFECDGLARAVREKYGVDISIETSSVAGEFLRSNVARIALEIGHVDSSEEYFALVHDVANAMAREGVRRDSGRRDLLLSQAILTLDDLEKTLNLFSNRVKEWYGLYFPELGDVMEGNEVYLKLVASLKEKEGFTDQRLVEGGVDSATAEALATLATTSMGGEMGDRDLSEIQKLANTLLHLYTSRDDVEKYVDELMMEVAPNLRSLAGSTLGARLIAFVGGLDNLAKKSASKIQVLGAEKALFRSFKTGTKPPKHGLIFQHKAVHQAPKWQRGKIARVLAGKLAIAARLDVYHGAYQGAKLAEEFNRRVEEIKEKYAAPPTTKRRTGRGR
jgi:nucleolar protein 56